MQLDHTVETKHSETSRRVLPLLQYAKSLFPEVSLDKVKIIAAQHIVSTTHAMFRMLFECGLPPQNLSVMGKCYSTNPKVLESMKADGIDICPSSIHFDSHQPFDSQYRINLKKFLAKRSAESQNSSELLIFLDDGGELLSLIPEFFTSSTPIVGIEQTSSGYHKIKRKNLQFPVINVARSAAKLHYESPFIGDSIAQIILKRIVNSDLSGKKILIIGGGFIGQSICTHLPHCDITIFDKDEEKSQINEDDFIPSLKNFDVIIGCTGKTVIPHGLHHLLKKGVILISASSSDREFDAAYLRKKINTYKNCHKDIEVEGIHLLNSGFPANFSSEFDKIDIDDFQLTRSLLFCAVLQAAMHHTPTKGFVDLDIENQRDIIEKFLKLSTHHSPFISVFSKGVTHARK